jgi:tRNA pseudouridine38-40 synthase
LPPLEYGRAWHVPEPLDLNLLRAAAAKFAGQHDFAGFAANRGKKNTDTVRNIKSVRVRKRSSCITIEFEGDGFLYKMVRLMVGAAVQCATGKLSVQEMAARLDSGRPNGPRPAAPAAGLLLFRVRY